MPRPLLPVALLVLLSATLARGGYEQPNYIDGCKSRDGRFLVTATQTVHGKSNHGPHEWTFTWTDTKTGESRTFPAQGIQRGQIHAQLFVAPDGETFALFNHVTLWSAERSEMHGPKDLPYHEDSDAWRGREEFSRRILVFRKDGSVVKELGVADLVQPDEWESVLRVFNRVEWCRPYDGLHFKTTPRMQYASYRVSPDYTVLEVQVAPPRAKKDQPPRAVRVSLVDGRILPREEWPTDPDRIPVRPFRDADKHPHSSPAWGESFRPSLDPVRTPGTYEIVSADDAFPVDRAPKPKPLQHGEVKRIHAGLKKADTPAWFPKKTAGRAEPFVLFTDLELEQTFLHVPPDGAVEVVRKGVSRGKAGPEGKLFGLLDGAIASWRPGEEPQILVDQAALGREVSLNDIAVSSRGRLYFTTLKDPDKGRLSTVDPQTRKVSVLFDGEQEPGLWNPNGVALDPDERFLYVGISSYQNRARSGLYAFPVLPDGGIDVAAGKDKPRIDVKAPDGIAVRRNGDVFFTAGGQVEVFDRYARRRGAIKLPKGSGSNLCFGGDQQQTLYVTTFDALYAVDVAE